MKAVERIREFISNLDEKSFYIMLGVTSFIIFLTAVLIMFYTRSQINVLQEQLVDINDQRVKIAVLLNRYDVVNKQRKEVDEILAREGARDEGFKFKILGYFQKVLDVLGMSKNLVQDPVPTTVRKDKDYEETSLNPMLKELSMKQLTDLLQKIAGYELVYIKKIEITRAESMPPSVNVNLTIATLKAAEVAE